MRVEEATTVETSVVTGVSEEHTEQKAEAGSSLWASRRVDWRFLLPDPLLGDVIGVEPLATTLAESLAIFSRSLTRVKLDDGDDTLQVAPVDLVVACNPSRVMVARMGALVKPDGFIYLEVHGLSSLLTGSRCMGQRRIGSSAAYRHVLSALGFTEVRRYWHWPNFENCKMMIPLDNRAAARLALRQAQGGQGLKAQVRAALGRVLVGSGLLPWTVPCFSVLARRSGTV